MRTEIANNPLWWTIWFKPSQAIEGIVAQNSKGQAWLIASLASISIIVSQFVFTSGRISLLLDWRAIAATLFGGAILGIVLLSVCGLFLRWTGRLFGGRAAPDEIRSALAWGQLPLILGVAICLALLPALNLAGEGRDILAVLFVAMSLWATIITLLMLAHVQKLGCMRTITSVIMGYLATYVLVSLLAVPFRSLVVEPFSVSSPSNEPTLQLGDIVLASKFSYGYSKYSVPFGIKFFSGRIFAAEPRLGDIVVFKRPGDESTDWIKRVLGLPGDEVQMKKGQLFINGTAVPKWPAGQFGTYDNSRHQVQIPVYEETLPNGMKYRVLDSDPNGLADSTAVYKVPPGHYFMIGDNRDNSIDSRFSTVGFVPNENLIGRVMLWNR